MSSVIMEDILASCMVENGLPVIDNTAFNTPYNPIPDIPYEPSTGNNYADLLNEVKLSNYNFVHMRKSLEEIVIHSREMCRFMNEKRLVFIPEEINVPVKFTNIDTEIPYTPIKVPNIHINKKSMNITSDTKEKQSKQHNDKKDKYYKSSDTKEKSSRKRKHSTSSNNEEAIKIAKSMKQKPIGKKDIKYSTND